MQYHEITREIGIDAAHRVTHHGSKCRSLHGHRYVIQATCRGPLITSGPSQGMVCDFSFLKEAMLAEIDAPCDHGTILWWDDPLQTTLTRGLLAVTVEGMDRTRACEILGPYGKLYLVPFVPTAEQLAKHWFERLAPNVLRRSDNRATLTRLRVYETPNCWADYTLDAGGTQAPGF